MHKEFAHILDILLPKWLCHIDEKRKAIGTSTAKPSLPLTPPELVQGGPLRIKRSGVDEVSLQHVGRVPAKELEVLFLILVSNSFLFLVVRPGAPSSVLYPPGQGVGSPNQDRGGWLKRSTNMAVAFVP